jgi:hypothetical protein
MIYEPAMYVMFVRVHDVSCEMPGMMSYRILSRRIRIGWISQAPGNY